MKKLLASLLCLPLLASLATADPQVKIDKETREAERGPDKEAPEKIKIDKETRDALLGPVEGVHAMVLAELAFARTSEQKGMRKAFLTYLAEDSVIFRPRPVAGKQWFVEHTSVSGHLNWQPTYAEVASSGDLGFSTGPYTFQGGTAEGDKKATVRHGHFVSVWEKQIEGWRVVVDHGIPHNKTRGKEKLEARVREGEQMGTLEEAIPALSEIDKKFANVSSMEQLQELYSEHGADDLRIYRRNVPPIAGKDKSLKALPKLSVMTSGELEGAGLSRHGDLAYSYGMGTMGQIDKDKRSEATFLRLWRNEGGQNWKLMLDLLMPLPESTSAPTS
jgi:ketosteroid isomerase-like protein